MGKSMLERTRGIATPVVQFVDGFLYFFRGLWFLAKNPVLWPYAALPFIINLFIVLAAAGALVLIVPHLTFNLWEVNSWWEWILFVLLMIIAAVAGLFFMYFLFFMLLPGIVSPVFKGKLTRYTRQLIKNVELRPAGGIWVDVIMPAIIETRKAIRFLLYSILLLPVNLIPVVGQLIYFGVMGYLTWYEFALNYLEYPIDSEAWVLPLDMKRKYIRSRLYPALGLGCAISLTCLVPFLNFFCMPVGVVGATLLYQAYGEQDGLDYHRDEKYKPWMG